MMLSRVAECLEDVAATRWVVAYSGGVDSHVLLHVVVRLAKSRPGVKVRAVHIDHQLQVESAAWACHCQQVCAELGGVRCGASDGVTVGRRQRGASGANDAITRWRRRCLQTRLYY